MKKQHLLLLISLLILASCNRSTTTHRYASVANDPLKTRIYTLDNGLAVYLSVNKDKPRVQTYIGVRVGGKNDPAETTGLAHYFEHLMFKGTPRFGTSDYDAEKPLLDKIEQLFETYRATADPDARKAIYARIDSASQQAAAYAIPNEYDKLMTSIGAQGTNAFTSYDYTAYVEDIPANEVENWARIQSERFTNPVIRGFHTELETVYEEYNMSLTSDSRKIYTAVMQALFPHHPYGTQTVLGTQEHLKNPSITNIKKYFETYYVPNNMAICMSGDIDPDETIRIINQYFGHLQPKPLPALQTQPETPITAPVVKEVIGLEAENVMLAYRLPAANTKAAATLEFVDYLLTNGTAGLLDLNLVQKQKLLRGGSTTAPMTDYSLFILYGTPKQGQTLDDVKNLLLEQIQLLKNGAFEDWLLQAVINNFKLERYYQLQEYQAAAGIFLNAFVNNVDWKDQVNRLDFQAQISKQDVIDFCNTYLNDNYALVYKREGKPDDKKIDKPAITPIPANRDAESAFLAEIKARETKPIEPVFIDYDRDLSKLTVKNLPLLYKQNTQNPLFSLCYVFQMGNNHDKMLGTAFSYLNYLGTSTRTAEEIKSEFYRLACSFGVQASNNRVYVYVEGLHDNFEKAVALLEERLADAKPDQTAYDNLVADILKQRTDAKLNQRTNFSRLNQYAIWGPHSPATHLLSENELKNLSPDDLVNKTKNLKNIQHTILYYGPLSENDIAETLARQHAVAETLQPVPQPAPFVQQTMNENKVLLAYYDAKQIYLSMNHNGATFDPAIEADRILYNTYFGGGMNSIVFQEMREARGLAYSAWAGYDRMEKPDHAYLLSTFIATQNDKMKEAIGTFLDILNQMPESEKAFRIARESILTDIRTERILRYDVLWNYFNAQEFGYQTDQRRDVFEKIPAMTLADVKAFQEKYVQNKPMTYCILGDTKALDMKALNAIGKVTVLTQEDIFGY